MDMTRLQNIKDVTDILEFDEWLIEYQICNRSRST